MEISGRIRSDLDEIHIGNLNTVDKDLNLPEKGRQGSCFSWSSGEERFLSAEGKVTRPLYGMGNRKVLLRCTAELKGERAERLFEVTVLQEEKKNRICAVLPVRLRSGEELPSVAVALCEDGRYITLPVRWDESRCMGEVSGTPLKAVAEICGKEPGAVREREAQEKVSYFPLRRIHLSEGSEYFLFRERMNAFLLQTDEDSMLYSFRRAAGLDPGAAAPMTGWDAWECKLRGHTAGHYLSALALAWASSGDARFLKKADYMVAELKRCREAFAESGTVKPGYFGAFDETQFDLLEKFTPYPEIWAPYYTLEKMMSGLYDVYTLAGNPDALLLLEGLGDWTYDRLSRLPAETRKKMWSMYIAGEYGGMIGILAKLSVLTGNGKYREAAGFFYNDKLFYPMERNIDVLEDMHANQHIPQVIGAMELYLAYGEERFLRIGNNFWDTVTAHHCYRTGGTGETEMFHGRDCEEAYLTDKTAESCAAYNMLRLTGQLFSVRPDGAYMDYYENTLINHILSSAAKDSSGGTVYFLPLAPGSRKEYSTEENTCCHGTGMESRYRFAEHIYAAGENRIYVNLYIPSELEGLLNVRQTGNGEFTVKVTGGTGKALCLRIPAWAAGKYVCSGKGKEERGYLVLPGPFADGQEIRIRFPMERRAIPVPGSRLKCIAEGPYLLAAVSGNRKKMRVGQAVKTAVRLHTLDAEPYHVYFEP